MSDLAPVSDPVLLARPRGGYCLRMLLVALGMWAAGAWFAYDGGVVYPRHNRQHAVLAQFEAAHPADAAMLWPDYAKQNGLEVNFNAASGQVHSDLDINTQWGIACFTALAGIGCMGFFLAARRRFVKLEGAGAGLTLSNHCGTRLTLADIEKIDASQWDAKGKAVVHGQGRRVKLDDWKMETDPTDAIFSALADAGVKVEGLAPETPPDPQ